MSDDRWYWSLTRKQAVPADDRERAEEVLGPYATREDAEHWRERVDANNEEWDAADAEWSGDTDEPGDADGGD